MVIQDDGLITYSFERLEIGLRPMTDAELNRKFPQQSTQGPVSTNPYTFGNWKRMGEEWTPPKH
ncbi:MAG: hypothetical protein F4Z57_01725, partial [Gemmatimonadetes bacterium]|nr:hypothetical protein [Gemmatimonadota bacterium]